MSLIPHSPDGHGSVVLSEAVAKERGLSPDRAISYAIIGVGGFLGIGKHDVAIPVNQFKADQNRIILPGATKDALKAMRKFEYK